ncbi:glycosyltransferase [candidate division WWE3 bacterium]|jgi:glycosyltransferase involved in cell wall biosynthesis|uniref:Glycosyltransferase n=1 Tax=candidate division WWE3 bacterium TaxID=2053526 RepID=A0A3A4ZNP2_UNCKA|nr:MAG: glycosyltransferase [candidate division WWE3 bacterium]
MDVVLSFLLGYILIVASIAFVALLIWIPPYFLYSPAARHNMLKEYPSVSIVIPAYNEGKVIARCLRAIRIAASRYPGKVEVILALDGCTDNTEAIALSVMKGYPDFKRLVGPNTGKSRRLQEAAREANGDLLAFMDADCEIPLNGISDMVTTITANPGSAVLPWIEPRVPSKKVAILSKLFVFWYTGPLRKAQSYLGTVSLWGCGYSMAPRAMVIKVLDHVRAWPLWTNNLDDIAMAYGFMDLGYKVILQESVVVHQQQAANASAYFQQRNRHASNRHLKLRKLFDIFPKRRWFVVGMLVIEALSLITLKPFVWVMAKLLKAGREWRPATSRW